MTDEAYLTTEEVMDYLQVNLQTVYALIKGGTIPAFRVGRQWRFRRRDIDACFEGQRRQSEPPARTATAPADGGRRPRVLVVDDEAAIRELLRKTLALAEYDVDVAPDGRAGLEQLRQSRYDLLMIDLKMPDLNGMTVIREVRRDQATLPIIIITGFSTESAAIDAINLGVDGYLQKPFSVPQVFALTTRVLGDQAIG